MSSSDLQLAKLSSFGVFALLKIGGACEAAGRRGAAAGSASWVIGPPGALGCLPRNY